jgi:radical SAM protein with 4Fe4S-binding SPASM domain
MPILNDFRDSCSEQLVPMQVTLELTYRCNERCSHCYLATYDDGADGRPPLRGEEWERILGELADAGSLLLVLIGGEAMLHKDFWRIAEQGAKRGFALSLITNGLLIDDVAADRMARLGFYNVSVSLYSRDPAVHDAMTRRKGSHARTVSAIERLKARGVPVGINCLLTRANIDGYFELERWAGERGVQIGFDPLVTAKSDSSLGSTATRAEPAQLFKFFRELRAQGRGPQPAPVSGAGDPICNAGRGKAAVNVYGDLLTCLEVRDPIGNLREHSFAELWHSDKADELRGLKNSELKFDPGCGDGAFCDHCPGMARAETGDALAAVPFLMDLAKIKRQVSEGV